MLAAIADDNRFEREANTLRYEYARSLRMTSRHYEAITNFEALDDTYHSKTGNAKAFSSDLRSGLDSQGDEDGAAEAAKRAITIDRHSSC